MKVILSLSKADFFRIGKRRTKDKLNWLQKAGETEEEEILPYVLKLAKTELLFQGF